MTFKHVKFEDSVVMRSLEKLAKEQGLVKEKPITKTASQKLAPTDNLTENVLALCDGLRARGFSKQAGELELKFLTLKKAQTLYETSKEKGEDLVDAAHPKGSHKLEDVDGEEAVFETIIDQHLKNMKMIEKTPTGKLASSRDVLRAVKVVLAEETKESLLAKIREQMTKLVSAVTTLDSKTSSELSVGLSGALGQGYMNTIQNLASKPTIDNLKTLQSVIGRMRYRLKPGLVMGLSEDKWSQVQPYVAAAEGAVAKAMDLRNQYNQMESAEATKQQEGGPTGEGGDKPDPNARQGTTVVMNEEGKSFISTVNGYLGALKSWAVTVNNDPENTDADKAEANRWITERTNELTSLRQQFMDEKDPNEQNTKAPGFLGALQKSKFVKESGEFKRVWIG